MKVYLDPHKNFAVYAPAKVGSSTIRDFIFEVATEEELKGHDDVLRVGDPNSLWKRFNKRVGHLHAPERETPFHALRVAVHRDPSERLLSYYRSHVQPKGQSLDEFLRRLYSRFAEVGPGAHTLRMHALPQVSYLGHDPTRYDIVLPLSRLGELPQILESRTGRQFPELRHRNKGSVPPPERLSPFAEEFIQAFTLVDRQAGWDGETFKA